MTPFEKYFREKAKNRAAFLASYPDYYNITDDELRAALAQVPLSESASEVVVEFRGNSCLLDTAKKFDLDQAVVRHLVLKSISEIRDERCKRLLQAILDHRNIMRGEIPEWCSQRSC